MDSELITAIKRTIKQLFRQQLLKRRIVSYHDSIGPEKDFRVVFGGHWSDHPGWLVLTEDDQDITIPLLFADESVDVVFTEHVIEHVSFLDGVAFMREARRILKPGGVFRAVSPVIEKLLSVPLDKEQDREYLLCLERSYPKEQKLFSTLKFDGLNEFYRTFLLNSIFTGYGHKFIWSAELMAKILKSLGYMEVHIYEVGQGSNEEYCIERRRRGLYLGNNWKQDRSLGYVYDAESLVVEAVK